MNAKPLEKLKLNGNDIGCSATQSSGDALAALTSLLASFQQTLSELNLADCKITIADSAHSSASNETAAVRDEAVWKRFFAAVKCLFVILSHFSKTNLYSNYHLCCV